MLHDEYIVYMYVLSPHVGQIGHCSCCHYSRKVSHVHLGTINGNKVDSQPKEPHRSLPEPHRSLPEPHRPLPEPPATHPNQLEPIVSVPNDGATSSEKKKKKKKKKKKSEAREEPEDQ